MFIIYLYTDFLEYVLILKLVSHWAAFIYSFCFTANDK